LTQCVEPGAAAQQETQTRRNEGHEEINFDFRVLRTFVLVLSRGWVESNVPFSAMSDQR
jgi:hypothetical protein